jgi:hypothetical protein
VVLLILADKVRCGFFGLARKAAIFTSALLNFRVEYHFQGLGFADVFEENTYFFRKRVGSKKYVYITSPQCIRTEPREIMNVFPPWLPESSPWVSPQTVPSSVKYSYKRLRILRRG